MLQSAHARQTKGSNSNQGKKKGDRDTPFLVDNPPKRCYIGHIESKEHMHMELNNTFVRVHTGATKAGVEIRDTVFRLLGHMQRNEIGMFITVDGKDVNIDGIRNGKNRIYLTKPTDYEMLDAKTGAAAVKADEDEDQGRTDDEIAADLKETFDILSEMTSAVANGVVKGLVVSGPAGVGKSHTVESTLDDTLGVQAKLMSRLPQYDVFKGNLSAITLYMTLYKYSEEGSVLVLDDCDGVLYDEDALNILKAALDTKKVRRIHWGTNSHILEKEGVPSSFEFKGGIIFLTNIDFENCKSARIINHLQAIMSRCHYIRITMNTLRERVIHMRNVVETTNMLADYNFTKNEVDEVMTFILGNVNKLREVTLRTVLKACDLKKAMHTTWAKTALRSLCK